MNNDQNPVYHSDALDSNEKPPIGTEDPLTDADTDFVPATETDTQKINKIADKAASKANQSEKKFDDDQLQPFTH